MQALTEAVAKVVEDHRQRGRPLAVWRNGEAVWMPVETADAVKHRPPTEPGRKRVKTYGKISEFCFSVLRP